MNVKDDIAASVAVKQKMLSDGHICSVTEQLGLMAAECLARGGRILLCGNGGSAADAQHIAAELSGRYGFDRPPLDAEALHVNTSYLTAVANDYSFEDVYSRLLQARGRKGDLLILLSTSGNSANILKAARTARHLGIITAGLTGSGGGQLGPLCDFLLAVPSSETPRIQEAHIMLGHILCRIIEQKMFGNE